MAAGNHNCAVRATHRGCAQAGPGHADPTEHLRARGLTSARQPIDRGTLFGPPDPPRDTQHAAKKGSPLVGIQILQHAPLDLVGNDALASLWSSLRISRDRAAKAWGPSTDPCAPRRPLTSATRQLPRAPSGASVFRLAPRVSVSARFGPRSGQPSLRRSRWTNSLRPLAGEGGPASPSVTTDGDAGRAPTTGRRPHRR